MPLESVCTPCEIVQTGLMSFLASYNCIGLCGTIYLQKVGSFRYRALFSARLPQNDLQPKLNRTEAHKSDRKDVWLCVTFEKK